MIGGGRTPGPHVIFAYWSSLLAHAGSVIILYIAEGEDSDVANVPILVRLEAFGAIAKSFAPRIASSWVKS